MDALRKVQEILPTTGRSGYLPRARPRNAPLEPLGETIHGCPVYGNGKERFFVHAGPEYKGRITLKIIQAAGDADGQYAVFCRVRPEQGRLHVEEIQNVYPGSEPDLISAHLPPHPGWRGFNFMAIIMEHLKKMAEGRGVRVITIVPQNKKLAGYYSRFGFAPDPLRKDGMQFVF